MTTCETGHADTQAATYQRLRRAGYTATEARQAALNTLYATPAPYDLTEVTHFLTSPLNTTRSAS